MARVATRTASAVADTVPMGKSVRARPHLPAMIPVPVPPARTAAMGRAPIVPAVRSSSAMARAPRPALTQVGLAAGPVGLVFVVLILAGLAGHYAVLIPAT